MFSIPPKPDFKRIASDFESQVLAQAKKILDAFIKRHFKEVRIGKADVVSGTHYKVIIQYVESEKIDLIIMGHRYHPSKSDFWRGRGKSFEACQCTCNVNQKQLK